MTWDWQGQNAGRRRRGRRLGSRHVARQHGQPSALGEVLVRLPQERLEAVQPDILGRLPKRVRRCAQVGVVAAVSEQAGSLDEAVDARRIRVLAKNPVCDHLRSKRQRLNDRRQKASQAIPVVRTQPGCVMVPLGRGQAGSQRMAHVPYALSDDDGCLGWARTDRSSARTRSMPETAMCLPALVQPAIMAPASRNIPVVHRRSNLFALRCVARNNVV